MKENLGLVYRGSKRRLAPDIISEIRRREPQATTLIDPFAGGLAIAAYASHHSFDVHTGEFDQYQSALISAIVDEAAPGYVELRRIARLPRFIERTEFFHVVGNPSAHPAWWVGYVMNLWSFGNATTSYLYGEKVVDGARHLHQVLVDGKRGSANAADPKRNQHLCRIRNLRRLNDANSNHFGNPIHHRHGSYEQTTKSALETISNGDAVVYCDPPYAGAAGYRTSDQFDHSAFWDWATKLSDSFPVYVSEYSAPTNWVEIGNWIVSLKSTANGNSGRRNEKLFVHESRA